ncbi:glycosyl hydrolase family 18 protein [Simiduia sp. 21SJ11W-1]|uniref:glycosyl hydrolase family 18 protein n=1 Tax=Simiduia sp. 21SJ11W-1 TaxID=2909669 RepID=UPI0020A083F6|nr:glycosyl hydrolase family 18 protein [Simiduia sp. 21SJ11W-1]UTA46781.1 glycosyl hydrolase family 18 protein [Simiduia sp. 21SJ11W-1]
MINQLMMKTACALVLSTTLAACGGGSGGGSTVEATITPDGNGGASVDVTITPDNNTGSGTDSGSSETTGNSTTENTGGTETSGNAGTGSTDSNNAGSGTTDSGNTGSGNMGSGNMGSGSTGSTGSGSVDSGSTGSGDMSSGGSDTGNTGSDNTESGASTNTETETDNSDTTENNTDETTENTPDENASQYPAWSASSTYNKGDRVAYEGQVYEAKWWSQNDVPSSNTGAGKPWELIGDDQGSTSTEDDTTENETTEDNTEENTDASNTDGGNGDANIDQTTDGNGTTGNGVRPQGQVVGTYFVEWGIYGRNYHVMDMPAEKLTHILYGFIPICGPNDSLQQANPSGYSALVSQCNGKQDYEVTIHDKFAALEKSYPGDNWDDPIRGNFGQLIKLKQQHPHLKVLPSVGGWTLSDPFFHLATDATKRAVFVNSVADFLRTYTLFDGVDIDWEFPGGRGANANLGSQADFEAYADLMRDLRAMLDDLEVELGKELELTSAIGTSPAMVAAANYGRAHQYMDYIFAMTYDYHGAWSGVLGHQTALNDYHYNTNDGFYAASVLDSLLMQNVPASKIVLGAAMYGRGWTNITGAQPEWPFGGQGNAPVKGSWEDGVVDYKDIVQNYLGGSQGTGINGFTYYYDADAEAPYLWNYSTGTLITYDNPRSVKAKAAFVKNNGLGGLFSWEIDGDNGDIVDAMIEGLAE